MKRYPFSFGAMGSPCELQLFADNALLANHCARAVINDIQRLEEKYSRYRADSYLSAINRVADSGGEIEVDDETAALLNYADACYHQSGGLFDISSGILGQAWKFSETRCPDTFEIQTLLARVGWHKIKWQPPKLAFAQPGMAIDFGGIVKEYAADRAAALCHGMDIHHGVVNLGGDIRIVGPRPDGNPWRIGIQHPRKPDATLQTLTLFEGAMATSGDYARFIMVDGRRYSHLLNPKTGWPVSHLAAVTVVADLCVVAGSASTIAMLKEQDGEAWLRSLETPYLCYGIDDSVNSSFAPTQISHMT